MDTLFSTELFKILQYLVPGFVGAILLYSLLPAYMPHRALDKIIHALILTTLGNAPSELLILLPDWYVPQTVLFILSIIFTILLAVFIAFCINNDIPHRWLRTISVTRETSYLTGWYGAFVTIDTDTWVVLHLKDGRQVLGLLDEYPSRQDSGIFIMKSASWIDENNKETIDTATATIDRLVIHAKDVQFVEFLKSNI